MPSAPDHYRFALGVLSSLGDRAAWVHPQLVLLGTQGPDPFYFYGELPWRRRAGKSRAAAFAEFLHGSDPRTVFPELARRAALDADRDDALSYLFGLLLHYLLDRAVHPYVYFRSGFDQGGELSGRFGVRHAMFETMMAESARGDASASETAPSRMFAADPRGLETADRLFSAGFPALVDPGCFKASWSDMASALNALWDPSGVKRRLLEVVGGSRTKTYAMIRPRRIEAGEGIDYLNAGRAAWLHPVSGAESNAGVAELTAAAAADAETAAAAIERLLRGESADWAALLRGINHEGHREGETKRFSRSVYE